jgi:hypothetical protein
MKYLIMTSLKESVTVGPKTSVAIWKSAKTWVQEKLAKGVLDCVYAYPEGGGFGIMNANSPEEVFDVVFDHPAHQWFHWEVIAICDWVHAYDKTIANYTRAASH